jgi:tetratricopeptide (TPR) repeat protein
VISAPFNPYIAGDPVKGQDVFFGRDDTFREVMQMLRHSPSNALALYGQRRIGKTSALLELERRLAGEGEFTPIYFDLQDKAAKPLADLLFELAQCIAARTGQAAPERVNFDSAGVYFRGTFLPIAARAAKRGGLVLLFDEFDVFDSPAPSQSSTAFFHHLRAWMAGVEGVRFLLVIGRRPEDLSIKTLSTFKGVRAVRVSLLEREAAEAVVRQSEKNGGLIWTDAAVEKVWDWAQGHAYFTQLLGSVVWENTYDAGQTTELSVAADDVDAAIEEALQQGANAFQWIWDGLPPAERVAVAAMAEAGGATTAWEKVEEILNQSGARVIGRELRLAPDALVEWGLLRSVDNGYRFAVPLLRRWVAANRPLQQVKDEVARLGSLAEGLFQTGQGFYSLGQRADAESQLRQALRINPNHLESRLLLGRILLEDNHVVESVALLEEAYQYDGEAARVDLIKSLLAMAGEQAGTELLTTYERILNIDPNQPVAREWWRATWVAQGEVAVALQQWTPAIEAFQKAGDLKRVEDVRQLKRKHELATQMKDAARFEAEENWDAAVAIYLILFREYPDESELQGRLENSQLQALLSQRYNEAIVALENGDAKSAQNLLAKVIGQQADYKEAARHLLRATTGSDIEALKAELAVERENRVAAEAAAKAAALARRQSEAQIEGLREQLDASRKEAARHLLRATTGPDVEALKAELAAEQEKRTAAQAAAEAAEIARRQSETLIEDLRRQLEASRNSLTSAVAQTVEERPPALIAPTPIFTPSPIPVVTQPLDPSKAAPHAMSVPNPASETEQHAHDDARKFARLMVSEIKLYNASKVSDGQRNYDLYDRLKDTIDRSRKVYDNRVSPVVAARFDYFYDELVQTLAEGDPAKLGKNCPGPVMLVSNGLPNE